MSAEQYANRNQPAIRFKGFSGEWLEFLLGEITQVIDGDRGSNYPNGDDLKDAGHTLFLSASNVTKDGFRFDERQYITADKSFSMGNGKLELNDIVLTSRGSVGYVAWFSKDIYQHTPYARINSGMLILRPDSSFVPSIVSQFLKSPLGKKKIDLLSFGSAQPQLTKKSVANYSLVMPPQKKEQTQIGACFGQLDRLIAQHQHKHDKLNNIKKALLEKMFPQQGATQPQIRFKGFSGDWEEKALGAIVEKAVDNRGRTPPLDSNGAFPVLEVASLGHAKPDYSVVTKYVNKKTYDTWFRDHLKEGDLLFSTVGNTGLVSLMDSFNGATIAQNIVAFRAINDNKANYLYSMFQLESNFNKAKRIEMGAVQPSLKVSQLIEVEYMITENKKEQTQIGNFFQQLDTLIKQQHTQLTKLNNVKQALLSKMFV